MVSDRRLKKTKINSSKRRPAKRHSRAKSAPVYDARELGVDEEQLLVPGVIAPSHVYRQIIDGREKFPRTPGETFTAGYFRRPLVSHRQSFWIGMGMGVLIIGMLGFIIWQLLRFEMIEAIVLN